MNRYWNECVCLVLFFSATATALGNVPGDADGDGDVDFGDFALMAVCASGPDVAAVEICQERFDFDFEADIDLRDMAAFQRCFAGDKQPVPGDCAPHIVRIEDGCLHVIGTSADSVLALRLAPGAAGELLVDVGNDGSAEFVVDRTTFDCIVIDARGGDDEVLIDEMNGIFTDVHPTTMNGGGGNDTLRGGSGGEVVAGEDGNDIIFLGGGSDRFVWEPGDDSDVVEGGGDFDTVEIDGAQLGEQFTITANGTRVRFDRLNLTPFNLDLNACEKLVLNASGGDDSLACTGNLAALIQITADGGAGDDRLLGSNGGDVLIGGGDDDFIDGQQGADVAFLGEGDDTFQWDPGDGSDTIEGQGGDDRILLNGSAGSEIFEFSANGARLRFTRNLGNVVLDADGVETLDLVALAGTDVAVVNDLTGTDLALINTNLASAQGGGDAAIDSVIVHATDDADGVLVTSDATGALVTGLHTVVRVTGAESNLDRLTINGLNGDDSLSGAGLAAGIIALTISGGNGADELIGSAAADVLNGDADGDTVSGGDGSDAISLGGGDDRFIWNPSEASDLVEGGDDLDTVLVSGAAVSEQFTITANGTRVRFDRLSPDAANLDLGGCEKLILQAEGGDDALACIGNLAALIQITADGGAGADTLLGSNGPDVLIGGDDDDFVDGQQGNDTVFLGDGDDLFQWDPGDGSDTIEGQQGLDTVLFNGSNASEICEFFGDGARLRFTRNIGAIVLNADDMELFHLRTLGGSDVVRVNDLTATALVDIRIELAGVLGGATGDGLLDAIVVNGTEAADGVHIAADAGLVVVSGLAADVRISTADALLDTLTVNGLGGADTITADPGIASLIQLIPNP